MFGLLYFLRNIALRYAQKRNCLFLTSTFLTSETRPAQVSGTTIAMCRKSSTFAAQLWTSDCTHDSVRIKSQVSPKWVPSKSHFLADKDGRKEGRRRIQKDSAGFRRIQKTLLDFACKGTKNFWDVQIYKNKISQNLQNYFLVVE